MIKAMEKEARSFMGQALAASHLASVAECVPERMNWRLRSIKALAKWDQYRTAISEVNYNRAQRRKIGA